MAQALPDYTNFVANTSGVANDLTQQGKTLMGWATDQGAKLSGIADTVSKRAGSMADWASGGAQDMLANWKRMYGPIYEAQAANTQAFTKDLPATMESWAGKYGADAAMGIDQQKEALTRKMAGQGFTRPGIAQGALDLAQGNQRALATVAAGEQGRMAARSYGDQLVANTEAAGRDYTNLSQNMAGIGINAGGQQVAAPAQAIQTTAGAYQPGISTYNAAQPWNQSGFNAMQQTYQNQLSSQKADQESESGGLLSTALPMVAGLGASMFAPGLGTLGAGLLTSAAPTMMAQGAAALRPGSKGATGGPVSMMARGGVPMAGNTVPPGMSPSGGAQVDDVMATVDGNSQAKAAINTGEFIIPRPAAEWYGEKFLQNLVAKAAKERQEQTVAAPQAGPPAPGALNTQAPMGAPA